MFELTGNYDQDIKLAEGYHSADPNRVKLNAIDTNLRGDGSIRFNYNLYDAQGNWLKTVEVYPQFEDSQMATEKLQSELAE